MRICRKCSVHPIASRSWCKRCISDANHSYHLSHKQQISKRQKRYREINREYHQDRMRRYYIKNRTTRIAKTLAWVKKNPQKVKAIRLKHYQKYVARYKVHNAIRSGILKQSPCNNCGNEKVQAHHENYAKPLEIIWMCAPCHSAKHHNLIQWHQLADVQRP